MGDKGTKMLTTYTARDVGPSPLFAPRTIRRVPHRTFHLQGYASPSIHALYFTANKVLTWKPLDRKGYSIVKAVSGVFDFHYWTERA